MNEKISSATLIALPYSILISSVYLFAYWDSFDVDFYSYITPSEIAVWSILPLISVCILSTVGIMIGAGNPTSEHRKSTSKLVKILMVAFNISMVVFLICMIYFKFYRWLIISSIFPLIFLFVIKRSDIIDANVLKKFLLPIFIGLYLPCVSFGYGKYNAEKITELTEFKAILTDNGCTNQIYLGKLDQFIFSYNLSSKATFIEKFDDKNPLRLKKLSKHDLTKNWCGTATLPHN